MKTFYLIVVVLLFLLMQATLATRIAFGAIAPDFVLLIVVFFALYRGAIPGALMGFSIGFLQDLGNPDLLGLNTMLHSILGYLIGRAASKTFADNIILFFALFFAAAFGRDIVYLFIYRWPSVGGAFVDVFLLALPSALYTALVAVIMDKLVATFGAKVVTSLGKEG
jgi:rod shape-determining protein MreD